MKNKADLYLEILEKRSAELVNENKLLRKALEIFANENNYDYSVLSRGTPFSSWKLAQEALKEKE